MLRTIAFCLAGLAAAAPAGATTSPEHAHLRLLHSDLQKLVDEGIAKSATLRSLVEQLNRTDVVVFVEYGGLPKDLAGGIRFVTRAGSLRLVRVSIRRTLTRPEILRTIGHELQHALEIADEPGIVDEASLKAFYRRLDTEANPLERFDTAAARRAGDFVAEDLLAWRRVGALPGPRATRLRQRAIR